ncbi:MAG TPA: hypothetical protein PLM79_16840 [Syntrophobacteraceae bacterium]|nr:hypothetical protein [Syntrophobacteraceae bacterium]
MREPEPLYRYFVKFHFEGREEPVIYEVGKATTEQISNNLEGTPELFCWFPTVRGREVAVNLRAIDLVHFLWEPVAGTSTKEEGESIEDDLDIVIYFRNRKEPFISGAAYPVEVSFIFDSLQLGGFHEDPFLWFSDEDDELVVIDARKLLCIEAPSEMIREGQEEMNKEASELMESMEEPNLQEPIPERTRKSPIPFRRRK